MTLEAKLRLKTHSLEIRRTELAIKGRGPWAISSRSGVAAALKGGRLERSASHVRRVDGPMSAASAMRDAAVKSGRDSATAATRYCA